MKKKRIPYFEGMRGLMAMLVVLCHFLCAYYPVARYTDFTGPSYSFLRLFSETPLYILLNGDLPVSFFFAITGYMAGRGIFRKGNADPGIVREKLVSRYCKFLPVVAIATIFTHLTMVLGLQYHLLLTDERINREFLARYCNFDANFGTLVANIFFRTYINFNDYIGPFWTLRYEMWEYVLALLGALVLGKHPLRRAWYILTIILLVRYLGPQYSAGFFGLIVADLQYNTEPTPWSKYYEPILKKRWFHILCFVLSLYFCAVSNDDKNVFYSFWYRIPLISYDVLRAFGASLLLFSVINLEFLQRFFSGKLLTTVGNLSFEIYAIHWPLMMSLEAGLFRLFERSLPYDGAAFLAFFLTLPVVYVCAKLMSVGIQKGQGFLQARKEKKTAEAV